jgi:hypothetical protein
MATTTNYGWETADDTDLVKDGALAMRTLGSAIDTTTKALNPSTTLGDIEYRSATANTNTRLGIGSTGNVLTVAGGVPSWAAPAGGTKTISLIASGSLSGASLTLSSLSTYDYLQLRINAVTRNANSQEYVRINNNSGGSNYPGTAFYQTGSTTGGWTYAATGVYFNFQGVIPTSSPANSMTIVFENCKEAGFTTWRSTSRYKNSSAADVIEQKEGVYIVAEAVSSLVLLGDGSFTAGNYELWGG